VCKKETWTSQGEATRERSKELETVHEATGVNIKVRGEQLWRECVGGVVGMALGIIMVESMGQSTERA
jgi:hypothetical protein